MCSIWRGGSQADSWLLPSDLAQLLSNVRSETRPTGNAHRPADSGLIECLGLALNAFLVSLPLPLAKHELLDLACRSLRQLAELHMLGTFEVR